MLNPSQKFWSGKKVLVTGHTGFKGAWLTHWLLRLGAKVVGAALPPNTSPSLFHLLNLETRVDSHFLDIRDNEKLNTLVSNYQPDIVVHMAAQPLVRASYVDPLTTFSTNVMGTASLLHALKESKPSIALIITTDKVYRNTGTYFPMRESDPLGGHDPYSASKAASELVVSSYVDSFLKDAGVVVATARAGNVVGGGDWSENRLIPDAVKAWQAGETLKIRNPQAVRPWQHVLEPLCGYLLLMERMYEDPSFSGAFNFGPETSEAATVRDVIARAFEVWPALNVEWGSEKECFHEAPYLSLEISKVKQALGYVPRWSLVDTIRNTFSWYAEQSNSNVSALDLCDMDIERFEVGSAANYQEKYLN